MSHTVPLVFLNDPGHYSEYIALSLTKIGWPNHGLHALRPENRTNIAFLATESRFCEIIILISTMTKSDASKALQERLYGELSRLSQEKEIQ